MKIKMEILKSVFDDHLRDFELADAIYMVAEREFIDFDRSCHLKWYPRLLRARRAGRKDIDRNRESSTKKDDGNRFLWYDYLCNSSGRRKRRIECLNGR